MEQSDKYTFHVTVPLKPHIKKYLDHQNYFKAGYTNSGTNPVGMFLQMLLRPKPKQFIPYPNYGTMIQVKIVSNCGNGRVWLGPPEINKFNNFVDRLIKDEMYKYIQHSNKSIKESIYAFLNKYEFLDAEMTYDRMERNYFRYLDRINSISQHD